MTRDTLTESVDGDLLFQKVLDKLWVFFSKYFVTFNTLSAARLTKKHSISDLQPFYSTKIGVILTIIINKN